MKPATNVSGEQPGWSCRVVLPHQPYRQRSRHILQEVSQCTAAVQPACRSRDPVEVPFCGCKVTTRPDAFGEGTGAFGGEIVQLRLEVVQILASLVAMRGNTHRHFGFVGKIGCSLLSSDCHRNLSQSLRSTSGINCGKSRKNQLPSSKTSTGSP